MADTGLTKGELLAELETLKQQNAALQQQLTATAEGVERVRQRWRTVVAVILIVLALAIAPAATTMVWGRNLLTNTERWVETVGPLASDPAIQASISDKLSSAISADLDAESIARQQLPADLQFLAVPIASASDALVERAVTAAVESDQFQAAWVSANQTAHAALVKVLQGKDTGVVTLSEGALNVDLGELAVRVKQRLLSSGLEAAAALPTDDVGSITLFQSSLLKQAQGWYSSIDTAGLVAPFLVFGMIGAAVFVSKDRRRTLMWSAIGLAGAMVVLGFTLAVARVSYIDAVAPELLSGAAAGALFDTLTRFLSSGIRAVFMLGLVVAGAAALVGPSRGAIATRAAVQRAFGAVDRKVGSTGADLGPVSAWVTPRKRALEVAIGAVAGAVVVFWDRPTSGTILWIALLAVIAVMAVEFFGREPGTDGAELPDDTPG